MTDLIKDGQALTGAKTRFGYDIRTYDDMFGPLWVLRTTLGIGGIVRAQTWEEAYEICEDEIFPSVDAEEMESWPTEFGENWWEDACWQEQFGYRPNGQRDAEDETGFYWRDLNGEYLDMLTPELVKELEIALQIEDED